MPPLLDSNDFVPIRKAIDVGLTNAGLPDEIIQQDIYLQAALDWVAAKVNVDSLPTEKRVFAKRAAIYYCAHLLAPVVNIPTSDAVQGVGASYTRKVMPPEANSARLLSLAEAEIARAAGSSTPTAEARAILPPTVSVRSKVRW